MPAWSSMFEQLAQGNLQNAFDYAFLDQETVDAGVQADRENEQITQDLYNRGILTEQEFRDSLDRLSGGAFPTLEDPNGGLFQQDDPWKGFKEGAAEGLQNEQNLVRSSIGKTIDFTGGLIPWQLWVIAVVVVGVILADRLLPKTET